MKYYVLFLLAVCLNLTACKQGNNPSQAVAVRAGTVTITEQDIEQSLSLLDAQDQKFAKTPFGRQNLLQILMREKLIEQDAHAKELEQDKDYQEALKQKRAELDAIYDQFAREALIRTWYTKNSEGFEPTEKDIKAYYNKYPYEMTIKQIIMDNAQTADQTLKTLKSSPGRWNELSRRHNIAPSSLQTLTFMPGEYLDNLEAVAANSPTGKVQGFFKTPQGFHIIMKTGEKRLGFDEAAPRIKQILQNKHLDELLDTLKTQYEVIIYEENK